MELERIQETWFVMKRSYILLSFVLLCSLIPLTRFVFASSDTVLINEKTFDVSVNPNATIAQVDIPFNVTLTGYNGTFVFQYENVLEGIRTDTCYLSQINIYLGERLVFTKSFGEHVQAVDVSNLNFTALPSSYNGTLSLFGTSEGFKFYGTTSLMLSENDPSSNGRVPLLQWNNSWLDFTALAFLVTPISVAIVLLVRRHRRRND